MKKQKDFFWHAIILASIIPILLCLLFFIITYINTTSMGEAARSYGALVASFIAIGIAYFTLQIHTKNVNKQIEHQKQLAKHNRFKDKIEDMALKLFELQGMVSKCRSSIVEDETTILLRAKFNQLEMLQISYEFIDTSYFQDFKKAFTTLEDLLCEIAENNNIFNDYNNTLNTIMYSGANNSMKAKKSYANFMTNFSKVYDEILIKNKQL